MVTKNIRPKAEVFQRLAPDDHINNDKTTLNHNPKRNTNKNFLNPNHNLRKLSMILRFFLKNYHQKPIKRKPPQKMIWGLIIFKN